MRIRPPPCFDITDDNFQSNAALVLLLLYATVKDQGCNEAETYLYILHEYKMK